MILAAHFWGGMDRAGAMSTPGSTVRGDLFAEPDNRNSLPIGLAGSPPTTVSVSQLTIAGETGVGGAEDAAGTVRGD